MSSTRWRIHLCLISGPTLFLFLWSASTIRGSDASSNHPTLPQDPVQFKDDVQIPLFVDEPAMHPWHLVGSLLGGAALANATASVFDYVNPLIGTTGADPAEYGGMIPSTAPPFGMTRWTPMTRENWVSRLPYHHNDTSIAGFIGTHQPAIWMVSSGYSAPPTSCANRVYFTGRFRVRSLMSRHRHRKTCVRRPRHAILALFRKSNTIPLHRHDVRQPNPKYHRRA
jgi:hypothetical protein